MPELKHDFSAAKMNKDLDERIVPNGQYRNAMNVQVRTTSGDGDGVGDAGTVQNLQGNSAVTEKIHWEFPYQSGGGNNETKIIGSIANEKNNKSYFFVAAPDIDSILEADNIADLIDAAYENTTYDSSKLFIDYIIEVDSASDSVTCNPIVVDNWGWIKHVKDVLTEGDTLSGDYVNGLNTVLVRGSVSDYRIGSEIWTYNSSGELVQYLGEIKNVEELDTTTPNGFVWLTMYDPVVTSGMAWWSQVVFVECRSPRVLNFKNLNDDGSSFNITGINIIDDLLFWTDSIDEPKKINIKRCKEGSKSNTNLTTWTNHTQLYLKSPEDSDLLVPFSPDIEDAVTTAVTSDIKKDHVTVIRPAPRTAPTIHMKQTDREGETDILSFYGNFAMWDNAGSGGQFAAPISTTENTTNNEITIPNALHIEQNEAYNDANPVSSSNILPHQDPTIFNGVDYRVNDILKFTEVAGSGKVWFTAMVNGVSEPGSTYTTLDLKILSTSGNLVPVTMSLTVNPDYGQVSPVIAGRGYWNISLEQKDPLFELKMGRFSTRYKYEDGEYSSFGPWSELAFLPGSFNFEAKTGYNLGMSNQMRELILRDFIPHQREKQHDIVSIDILYKTTESPNVYTVKTIIRGKDSEWDLFTTQPNGNETYVFGEMSITSEMIHKALPGNQLLRGWDNVPKNALAQEVAANRIVYANYEQGYDLDGKVGLVQSLKNYNTASILNPQKSIKTLRDYKFGMVFGDKYGRETPVIVPGYLTGTAPSNYRLEAGDVSVKKTFAPMKNTFELEQKWNDPLLSSEPDSWILDGGYVKYFVKETSNEYYNLVMDRWYRADNSNHNVWIAFASADRNKLTEDTYLILKNEHGQSTPVVEKGRYKILAIENEAPDFIKTDYRQLGMIRLSHWSDEWMFSPQAMTNVTDPQAELWDILSPTQLMEGTEIKIHEDAWGQFLKDYVAKGDFQIRIKGRIFNTSTNGIVAETGGSEWRLITYHGAEEITAGDDNNDATLCAVLRWDLPFNQSADIYDQCAALVPNMGPNDQIQYLIEFRERVVANKPEFDGKFFVKIEKDEVLAQKVLLETQASSDFDVVKRYDLAYIDNSEHNPGAYDNVNSGDIESMPRQIYKWFDTSDDESDTTGGLYYGVAVSGSTSFNENVVPSTPWDNSGSQYFCFNSNCTSVDGEFLALGCDGQDGSSEADETDLEPYQGGGVYGASGFGDKNTENNVYNRVNYTRYFWWWWQQVASPFHNTKLFVDGARVRTVRYKNDGTLPPNPNPSAEGIDQDLEFNFANGLGVPTDGWLNYQGANFGGNSDDLDAACVGYQGYHDPNDDTWNQTPNSNWTYWDSMLASIDVSIYGYGGNNSGVAPGSSIVYNPPSGGDICAESANPHRNKWWPGLYYKPTGFDGGVMGGVDHSPTNDGDLGRMMISVMDDPDGDSGFFESDEAFDLKNFFQNKTTYFRFADDPNKQIYRIVGDLREEFTMWNYSASSMAGVHSYWGDSSYIWANHGTHFRPDGFWNPSSNWGTLPLVFFGGIGPISDGTDGYPAGVSMANRLASYGINQAVQRIWWTNKNPVHPDYSMQDCDGCDPNEPKYVAAGAVGWSSPLSNFNEGIGGAIKGPNFSDIWLDINSNEQNPFNKALGMSPGSDGGQSDGYVGNFGSDYQTPDPTLMRNVPEDWDYNSFIGSNGVVQPDTVVPLTSFGNYKCEPCNDRFAQPSPGTGPANVDANEYTPDVHCRRRGFRFEFRRVDEFSGSLMIGENGVGGRGIDTSDWDPRSAVCHDGRESFEIEILKRAATAQGETVIPIANAACWETEPKEDVGLDIYYEASNALPMRLNSENTTSFVPYNSKVKLKRYTGSQYMFKRYGFNTNLSSPSQSLTINDVGFSAEDSQYVFHIGYTREHSIIGIKSKQRIMVDTDADDVLDTMEWSDEATVLQTNIVASTNTSVADFLVFTHPDGTRTMSQVIAHMEPQGEVNSISETVFKESSTATGYYKIDSDVYKFPVELSWHNCYSFGNGVESDRIRDDYNANQIDNGVKVSTTFLDYGKERRGSGMIYSGLFNSTSGVNDLNEFNMAEKITKDINPSYGSIQRLKTRDTDMVIFAEDKTLKTITNKDALYNADGNPQLLASNRVLGTAVPFSGDYGISKNPESLAWDQFRMYFTDLQRGAVLRLSRDGLTPINKVGMVTWFRDHLKKANNLLGTFDMINGEYNLSLNWKAGGSTTISFNEDSKGWVSFKSFVPQAGVSVGGKYITAVSKDLGSSVPKKGVWEHYVDIKKEDTTASNFDEVINRNVFYAPAESVQCDGDTTSLACLNVVDVDNYFHNSTIDVMFNDQPSSVKAFRAVGYEGSQSRVHRFTSYNISANDSPDGVTPLASMKDGNYDNLENKDGWFVSHIKSDLSFGAYVKEFKNREGKWFNNITSQARTSLTDSDFSEFSVQGLGQMLNDAVSEGAQVVSLSIDSDMVDDWDNDGAENYGDFTDGSSTEWSN